MARKTTALFYGMNPPFLGGPQNIMSRQEDDRLIKNDILQLLLTVPGERVMRPDFGVNLRNFVFEQMTTGDISSLRSEIIQQINKYEQRVTIQTIEMVPEPDQHRLQIKIIVNLKKDPQRQLIIEQFVRGIQP